MIPLMIVSVVLWTLIINRVFFFRRLYRKNMSRKTALEYVKAGEFPDAKKYSGAIALLVTGFQRRRSGRTGVDRFILDETVIVIVSSLDRHLGLIGVLAALAPLLGLLGTVTGMIATFDIISIFGTGNARAMAGGISEALITTQTGLVVAIPGLYMSNFLNRRSENLKQRIASVGIYLRRYV
ncbi:MAG: MotA/TolQ/ExbB proton channel family protein [Deltaproteobacteria bacterium]|nr:MotA/TolQ/ExbB proton channel family protein [Deltaproteobacteria bacterium]MBW2087623.1 MotA/TolQ/ExbB proton channel family protein [Deltaproteobacteria bacterium]